MLKIENITSKINVKEESSSSNESTYTMGPLYRGYGNTIGNALRRVILSSIPGCAIKGIKIDGVSTEYSIIPGVKENVVDIILNLKAIVFKSTTHGERKISLSVKGPTVVKAKDIKCDSTLKVVNGNQVIANITDDVELNMELLVDTGEGFVIASEVDKSKWPVGFLAIDALYSPVKSVNYSVESTMVGRITDYDKLTINLKTNGSVNAKDMMSYAVELLYNCLKPLTGIGNAMSHLRNEERDEENEDTASSKSTVPDLKLEDLDFSVRAYNCLKKADFNALSDLASLSKKDLMVIKNFGRNSMNEVIEKLKEFGIEIV